MMLGNGCGGKTAVPTVSPADAQPSDEDDLGNSTGGRSIRLCWILLKWIFTMRRIIRSSAPMRMVKEVS